jgi:hypothetical protein
MRVMGKPPKGVCPPAILRGTGSLPLAARLGRRDAAPLTTECGTAAKLGEVDDESEIRLCRLAQVGAQLLDVIDEKAERIVLHG